LKTNNVLAVVLAAGRGSRMKVDIPKQLVEVRMRPILTWIVDDFKSNSIDVALVINPDEENHFKDFKDIAHFVYQAVPKGTGHALIQALEIIKQYELVYVFVGDSPFVGQSTIKKMLEAHIKDSADCTIVSSDFKKSFPYARVLRSDNGRVLGCIEEKNANTFQKNIKELFCSHYLFNSSIIQKYIFKIDPDSDNQEIYLTDIINLLVQDRKKISVLKVDNWRRLVGLNTKEDVDWIESQDLS
tara:strand:+ start:2519 stop:3247 length:729 start_codon:yes stop_codon:yes gene_type:complete